MARFDLSQITPFRAVPVGEYIKDELDAREMKQKELANLTGIQPSILNDIIKGRRDLTAEQSILIGHALEINDDFFYDLQKQYDLDKARISERVAQQSAAMTIWNVLKDIISVKYFKKVGVLGDDIKKNVESIFRIFNVENLEALLMLREQEVQLVYYKKSEKLTTNAEDLFSWKYYSLYLASKEQIDTPFNQDNIQSLCNELNNIFEQNNHVIESTRSICKKYGIKFIVSEKEGQVPVDGMSCIQNGVPTIVLTKRRGTIDNFAFSMMHELGHIKLHLKDSDKVFVSISNEEFNNSYEDEADSFAREQLISSELWKQFRMQTKNVSSYTIQPYIERFAQEHHINPQIVLGRYTFETNSYKMRSRFAKTIN